MPCFLQFFLLGWDYQFARPSRVGEAMLVDCISWKLYEGCVARGLCYNLTMQVWLK
jgi:hypothetical protein